MHSSDATGASGLTRTRATVEGVVAGAVVALVALSVGDWALGFGPPIVGGALAGYRSPGGRLEGAVCGLGVGLVLAAGASWWVVDTVFAGTPGASGGTPVGVFGALVLAMVGWLVAPTVGFLAAGRGGGDDPTGSAADAAGRRSESSARARR